MKKVFHILGIMILLSGIKVIHAQTILFSPDTLYMGMIPVSSNAVRQLIIYNIGSSDLEVSNIEIRNDSQGAFTILNNPGTATIRLAQRITLDIEFAPEATGSFEVDVHVTSNTDNGLTTVPIMCKGVSGPPIYFERIFGPDEGGGLGSIQQTLDGGYILAGSTENPDEEVGDPYLVKTNAKGAIQWSTTIANPDRSEGASAILQTSDGNYMMFGSTRRDNTGQSDYLLAKLDATGNEIWRKTYGGSDDENPSDMIEATDGGYLLVGNSISFSTSQDFYIVKVDASGNEQWSQTYGGDSGDGPNEVIATQDGGYAIVGRTESKGFGDQDIWVVKIDASGNLQWDKTYGGANRDSGADIAQLTDGGYAVAGYAIGFGPGARDMFLVRTDASGNELWHSAFGRTYQDGASNVLVDTDGILLAGSMEVIIDDWDEYSDMFLIKTDFDGVEQWRMQFGGRMNEGASEMIFNTGGNIVITGGTTSYHKDRLVYFLRIAAWGPTSITETDRLPAGISLLTNYPNPFNNSTMISYRLEEFGPIRFNIYNVQGELVRTLLDSYQTAGRYTLRFDAAGLSSGVYLGELQSAGGRLVQKMLLLK